MIFLTTGTQLPFDRLVRAVDAWAEAAQPGCEIFGQVLSPPEAPYRPRNFETRTRLSPAEYAEIFEKARLIVSHAGMGTILTALTRGKQICIMPRQVKYGEHRSDHQLATVERLGAHPGLHKARDEHDLAGCLDRALAEGESLQIATIDPFAAADFSDRLRAFILSTEK
ncbi:glycosyltransferase [Roseovarius spongiae]|uniref:glycosyltransferase n=1 Tax=Roseovarius spongiae TaxID=2320272 RepID=UPI0014074FC9|nr:glycosyltransferase [Roseovarius spongiae]